MKKAGFFEVYEEQHKNDTPATPAAVPEVVTAPDPVEVPASEAIEPVIKAPEAKQEDPAEGGNNEQTEDE